MKKLLLTLSLACALTPTITTAKNVELTNPMLQAADAAGFFNGPILDILKTREAIIDLVVGKKMWNGAIVKFNVDKSDAELTAYLRRPETLFGATFIAVTIDHKNINSLIAADHKEAVDKFIAHKKHKSLYERQIHASTDTIFTGSYAINPINGEQLPIYISDYAIESFDIRRTQTRIGVPAHNSKDFKFANQHNIAVKIVITAPDELIGVENNSGPILESPHVNSQGVLVEPYVGEYRECVLQNSDQFDDMNVLVATKKIIEFLEENDNGVAHNEPLQYDYDGQFHSIKNLAKVEAFIDSKRDQLQKETVEEKMQELQILLNYAQADFLEIVEPFFQNAKNTKELMMQLIEESCKLRDNQDCYLLKWCHLDTDQDERVIFHRDITSIRYLTIFCKDLVNFLGDLAHSCPRALEDLHRRSS